MSQTQATQPEVANYITDIFGADSDDEQEAPSLPVARATPASFVNNDDDDIALQDSDDEAPTQKPNRFKKGNSQSTADDDDDDDKIEDSDEDDANKVGTKKKTLKKKRKEGGSTSRSKDDGNKLKKRKQNISSSGSSSSSSSSKNPAATDGKEDEPERASGDEYDSGDEVQRTAEDDRFIDEDDDLAGVAGEYDNEEQVFDDERPDDYVSGKGKSKPGRGSSSDGGSRKSADPFSETLEAMKKPKAVLMSEAEKDKITERLLLRMHDAFVKDEALFKQGEPAVHKLQMLRTVQQMVAVKTLQHNLLEKDILGAFKDWIEPKRDTAKTLPSLTVRTAVYDMLTKLPCQTDHLKRTEGDKKPIGYTILALRKHKLETPENKRMLKELMEKWCRPVFRKSADARSSTRDASATAELTALAMERHAATTAASAAAAAAARATTNEEDEDGEYQGERGSRDSSARGSGFDAALAGTTAAGGKDIYMRARTPYSNGFLFTVQPDAKVVERKESNEKAFGQTRALLLKKMSNSGKGGGGGTKVNPRAMDMAMTGRNKA